MIEGVGIGKQTAPIQRASHSISSHAVEHHRRFVVEQQTARVEVRRAAQRDAPIEHDRLGVIHGVQQVNRHARRAQRAQRPIARKVGQAVIRFQRNAQIDLHAAPRGQPQGRFQDRVRQEVGRDGENALRRVKARIDQQGVHRVLGLVGSARQELGPACGDSGVWRGADRLAVARRTAGRRAADGDRRRRRPSPPRIERPPMPPPDPRDRTTGRAMAARSVGSAEVLRRKVASACPQERPVGNRPFAVVAQIARTRGLACEQRTEYRRLHAGRAQAPQARLLGSWIAHTPSRRNRTLTPRAAHAIIAAVASSPNASSPKNEGADVQPLIGAAHQLEQRGTRLGAVLMHAHPRRGGGRQSEALDEVFRPMFGVRAGRRPGARSGA